MTLFHAVVWADHHTAQVLQFDAEQVNAQKVHAHTHHTAQHGSEVRTQHEFFAQLCEAVAGIPQVLLTGAHTTLADLRHYIEKHRPQLAPAIVGYEVVDHPSENQLVAFARQYFLRHDKLAGTPAAK